MDARSFPPPPPPQHHHQYYPYHEHQQQHQPPPPPAHHHHLHSPQHNIVTPVPGLYHSLTPSSTATSVCADDYEYEYGANPIYVCPPPYSYLAAPITVVKREHSNGFINMADIPAALVTEPPKMEYPDDSALRASSSPPDGPFEMDQDEVDAIIRNKRKVRDPKACYACHRRKVKCDRGLPCDSCVKRDHPELCSYERPSKRKKIALNNKLTPASDGAISDGHDAPVKPSGPNVVVPREQWERINAELQRLKANLGTAPANFVATVPQDTDDMVTATSSDVHEREGIHAPSIQMGTMHLGSRSVLAYMMGNKSQSTQDQARVLLEENILPNLGLDNETATYPFVDLWSTESSIQDVSGLCRALPEDQLCRDFWTAYRDVACTIYPVVPDTKSFGEQLEYMLRQRSETNHQGLNIDPDRPYGVPMPWLALVFAVLASGAQCTDRGAKERELTSQVYICCAYQALRMANFLSHPCLETIEACLIIGNALAYNMNPGVAYTFLGMTLRSAFTMGIHVNSQNFSDEENYFRGRIWWALAWQDSHFSVSYDRPSSSLLCFPDIPYMKHSSPGNRSYVETLSAIIRLTQDILRARAVNPSKAITWTAISRWRDEVHRIMDDASPKLRERNLCLTTEDHLERLAFKLHASYVISEICRPALKESQPTGGSHSSTPVNSPRTDKAHQRRSPLSGLSTQSESSESAGPLQAQLRADCIEHLESVVQAYVELHGVSVFAARSWIGIQRGISAAFLLGIIPETRQQPRIVHLLKQLELYIAQRASEDLGFHPTADQVASPVAAARTRMSIVNEEGGKPGIGESPNWARSMTKSLNALQNMNVALAARDSAHSSPAGMNTLTRSAFPTIPSPQHPATFQPIAPVGAHQSSHIPAKSRVSPAVSPVVPVSINSHQHYPQPSRPVGPGSVPSAGLAVYPPTQPRFSPVSQTNTIARPSAPASASGSVPTAYAPQGTDRLAAVSATNLHAAPVTPDSAGSGMSANEWTYGNMKERVLPYVHPGIWG